MLCQIYVTHPQKGQSAVSAASAASPQNTTCAVVCGGSAKVAIDMIIIKILCPHGNKGAIWLVKKIEPQLRHEFLDHVTTDHALTG